MDWINILIYISILLCLVEIIISIGSRVYKENRKYSSIFYILGSLLFLSEKGFSYPKEMVLYVSIIYLSISLRYAEWILEHLGYSRKVRIKMTEYLGHAYPVTWEILHAIPLNEVAEYPFATSRKLSQTVDKMVFESHLNGNDIYYFSDFIKEFHVMDGFLTIEYKDGRIEHLKKNQRTVISAYEVHRLITENCKLLVTCIN